MSEATNETLPTVTGQALRHDNDELVIKKGKTGAGSMSIMSQKDYVKREQEKDATLTRNGAKRKFLAYRADHARMLNEGVSREMAAGRLLIGRIGLSKTGAVRSASFLTPKDASGVRINEAQRSLAKELHVPIEALEALIVAGKRKAKEDADEKKDKTTDVEASASQPAEGATVSGEAVPVEANA